MSRLAYRGRAQQSVISIVNCKIPRITRILNVHCAFGVSLKACLLQCLINSCRILCRVMRCFGVFMSFAASHTTTSLCASGLSSSLRRMLCIVLNPLGRLILAFLSSIAAVVHWRKSNLHSFALDTHLNSISFGFVVYFVLLL